VYRTTFSGGIHRVPLAGGSRETLAEGETRPHSLTVGSSFLYWATGSKDGAIRRMTRTGGKPETFASEQAEPTGLVVNAGQLFWVNESGGTVVRAPQ
jgi:streptogramin lyase